jgi:hypothetical protein
MTRRRSYVLTPLALIAVVAAGGGCSTAIVPPRVEPARATQVLVADYGYHSTVIFPNSQGKLTEYAYGDYTFFCQNQKSILTALHALFCSEQATIGRRELPQKTDDEAAFNKAIGAVGVLKFDVPADRVRELERTLARRFTETNEKPFFSNVHHLFFVRDAEHYGIAHNCNHFTAENLEILGCKLEGWPVLSKFHLAKREDDDPDAPPAAAPGH